MAKKARKKKVARRREPEKPLSAEEKEREEFDNALREFTDAIGDIQSTMEDLDSDFSVSLIDCDADDIECMIGYLDDVASVARDGTEEGKTALRIAHKHIYTKEIKELEELVKRCQARVAELKRALEKEK